MSSDGWCSVSLTEGDISRATEEHLLVNFGAEVVVEAIGTTPATNGNYLQRYMVEYARSDGQFFYVSGEDETVRNLSLNCANNNICNIGHGMTMNKNNFMMLVAGIGLQAN